MAGTATASTSTSMPSPSSFPQKSKRLIFDRRYGWVIDEWKDPSDQALSGGRGMLINLAASSAVKTLERPDLFSPQVLQASLNDQLHKLKLSLTKSDTNSFPNSFSLKGNLSSPSAGCSSH
ncbi:hypothetical protein PanWU01x14_027530 [Parasponia andersonii]|uniref:Uncharacterized protein n=1 Tax=Parasponia andersonii TaxID=3476 RepID=A0A2P5DWC5_PARAD|nr:hypothetical protein PanWU01x14_027530 [Parasponia andersonii]